MAKVSLESNRRPQPELDALRASGLRAAEQASTGKEPALKVLFVTRKHPPSVGGMQLLSYHLVNGMRRYAQVHAIAWGRSQKLLPLFFPYAAARSLLLAARGVDVVHVGDAVMAPVGLLVRRSYRIPLVVTVHGLDVIYASAFYQRVFPKFVARCDCVVCNSQATREACATRGIPTERCTVVSPGVELPTQVPERAAARRWLAGRLAVDLDGAPVLLTVGRLVPRKGVAWFISSVFPLLAAGASPPCYVVAGEGPDEARIRAAIVGTAKAGSVHLMGKVSQEELELLYAAADLFVMPNLPWPGDLEGFGLVALEAAARGLPVLASGIEGIVDAVIPGQTGCLVPAGEPAAWAASLAGLLLPGSELSAMRSTAPQAVAGCCTWDDMVGRYAALFRALAGKPA